MRELMYYQLIQLNPQQGNQAESVIGSVLADKYLWIICNHELALRDNLVLFTEAMC